MLKLAFPFSCSFIELVLSQYRIVVFILCPSALINNFEHRTLDIAWSSPTSSASVELGYGTKFTFSERHRGSSVTLVLVPMYCERRVDIPLNRLGVVGFQCSHFILCHLQEHQYRMSCEKSNTGLNVLPRTLAKEHTFHDEGVKNSLSLSLSLSSFLDFGSTEKQFIRSWEGAYTFKLRRKVLDHRLDVLSHVHSQHSWT